MPFCRVSAIKGPAKINVRGTFAIKDGNNFFYNAINTPGASYKEILYVLEVFYS